MSSMTTPIVTELPLRLEPITADSFAAPIPVALAPQRGPAHAQHVPDHVMNYIECDLAAELTLPQRRRCRATADSRRRLSLRTVFAPARRGTALAA